MLTIEQANIARGEAKGKAEAILRKARQRFPHISEEWEAQVLALEGEQQDEVLDRVAVAPNPESVINGSDGRT